MRLSRRQELQHHELDGRNTTNWTGGRLEFAANWTAQQAVIPANWTGETPRTGRVEMCGKSVKLRFPTNWTGEL